MNGKLVSLLGLVFLLVSSKGLAADYQIKHYPKKHHFGLKRTQESKKTMMMFEHREIEALPVPAAVDLSPMVSLPEDQGQCGSCWDFALTKALRSEYMLQGKSLPSLEFNYLLNNCGPGPKMDGCNGGDFPAAQSFEVGHGPGLNSQNPYTARQGSCKHLPVSATAVNYAMLGPSNGSPSFRDLAYAMGVEKHVLVTDVAAGSGNWEYYSGGIYNGCVNGQIDHMVNIVGYNCETSVDSSKNCLFDSAGKPAHGDGYLLLMNQWGEQWGTKAANGHGGYMKTRMYDKAGNHCNAVASDALYFSVKLAPPPSPKPSPTPSPVPKVKSCDKFLCSAMCWLPWCD